MEGGVEGGEPTVAVNEGPTATLPGRGRWTVGGEEGPLGRGIMIPFVAGVNLVGGGLRLPPGGVAIAVRGDVPGFGSGA